MSDKVIFDKKFETSEGMNSVGIMNRNQLSV